MQYLLSLLLLFFISTQAMANSVALAPTPGWVRTFYPLLTQEAFVPQSITGGMYYLYISKQVMLKQQSESVYYAVAKKILDRSGLDNNAFIKVHYDPTMENLTFNALNIIRHGHIIHELSKSHLLIATQEPGLPDNIYDKTQTVSIALKNLKIGDVIFYSYTKTLKDTSLQLPFSTSFYLNFPWPVHEAYMSLTNAANKKLYLKSFRTTKKPRVMHHGGITQYSWTTHDAPAISIEPNIPSWYFSIPIIQLSEIKNWSILASKFSPYFAVPEHISIPLAQKIQQIKQQFPGKKQQVQAVYNFIQNNIHYTGFETGIHSIKPFAPSIVYQRAYGDCKDTAFLMVTMLQHLGIKAHVALVNTKHMRHIIKLLPAFGDFNHAIVQVTLSGKHYWLDPTRTSPSTDFTKMYIPDYGYALVLHSEKSGLIPIDSKQESKTEIITNEFYTVDQNIKKPVMYTLKLKYIGGEAALMRSITSQLSLSNLGQRYNTLLQDYYPDSMLLQPPTIDNNRRQNTFTITMKFNLPHFWQFDDEDQEYFAKLKALIVDYYLQNVTPFPRTMPLALIYPLTVKEHVIVNLPSTWNVRNNTFHLKDPVFLFNKKIVYDNKNKKITIDYQYKNTKSYVNLKNMKTYYDHINTIQSNRLTNIITLRNY